MIFFVTISAFIATCIAYRNSMQHVDISVIDSSNCTWTSWTECKLESDTRCARTRLLEVLPLDAQDTEKPDKIPCNGQAGTVESSGCTDGMCPKWIVGDWTDCSGTCNSTMRPWEGLQRRDLVCQDDSGILYRTDVCVNLYGVTVKPEEERPCECSHKLKPFDPYAVNYKPVDV